MARAGTSTLEERLCPLGIFRGIAGTGGALRAGGTAPLRAGDWPRNVRSLMEAELPGRVSEGARELLPPTLPPN
jgi:hypothetical protein